MSVIHVKSRATHSPEDFQAHRASDRSRILLDERTRIDSYSIDLTVGANWSSAYGPTNNAMFAIPDGGIRFAASRSVVVEVAETMTVPYNMYGLVIPTGSQFLDRGIILAAAKIEPSFNGRLKLRLVNTSGEPRTLHRGEKIASAMFFATEITAFEKEILKTVVVATAPMKRSAIVRGWAAANWPQIVTWVIASAALAVSAAAFYFTRYAAAPAAPAIGTSVAATKAT